MNCVYRNYAVIILFRVWSLRVVIVIASFFSYKVCAQEVSASLLSPPVNFSLASKINFTTNVHVQLLKPIFSLTPQNFFETIATFELTNKLESGASFPDMIYSVVQRQGLIASPNSADQLRSYKSAFNGSELQMMTYPESRLCISRVTPLYDNIVYDANGLFLPFRFISDKQTMVEGGLETLASVCSADKWLKVQNVIKSGKFTVSTDKRYITFDLPIYSFSQKKNVTYKVTLDRQGNFFPVHWIMIAADGKLIQEYQITELAKFPINSKLSFFVYPKIAVLSDYKDGKIISKSTVATTNVQVEVGDVNSEDFTIDPASADMIWDNDKEVLIHVPR